MVGNLPPRADSFQDRAATEILHRTTGPGQTTVLTQVVAGLGGVGKTQLAAEFARQLWRDGELDLLLWVSALSRDSVVSGYVQAGADLALGPENEGPERTAARLLAWLANTRQRWLIILDDLAGPADIRDLWPPDRPNGRTVVTTRRRDADLLAGRNLVEVSVFTETEATEYVRRKLKARPYLADDVPGVVTDLGALPLALGHAAAYMIDLDLPCSTYRDRFSDRRRRLAELFPDPDTLYIEYFGPRHPDTLAVRNQLGTWQGDAGQTQEAITSLGSLISDVTAALGRDHPMAIAARQNLGYQWGQAGYPAKAVTELTIVLDDQVRVLGPDDPAVLATRSHLVYWRAKSGDITNEVAELEALVQLATKILGADDRKTFELRGALAPSRADSIGNAQSAIEMQEILDDMRRALGPEHRDVSVITATSSRPTTFSAKCSPTCKTSPEPPWSSKK